MESNNRSLERGIEILRAFRPGIDRLGNGDIAERTGLPRATVSRLTHTLVEAGMLHRMPGRRGYSLAPATLSLAHAMRSGSTVLQVAAPLMRSLAESCRINVGLAAPDRDEMVYLESIRYSRRQAFRNVVSGQRVPIELTSLGRAYLAVAPDPERRRLHGVFRRRRLEHWPALRGQIEQAIAQVRALGYCVASWQPEVVAVATPICTPGGIYVLNVSASSGETIDSMVSAHAQRLLALRQRIEEETGDDNAAARRRR
ncbi:MAG: IclR family transcriptional regulator [Burkholderiales bacterium]|nr:IclR family transcriptional regulator [Burkholderiales bacterium]